MRWATIVLAGCAYHGGSYADYAGAWPGTRVELGCLDLAVARSGDVITYSFGNRCDARVTVDLANVRVTSDGALARPYDPRGEIRVATLPARFLGRESIQYAPAGEHVCVDIGGINADLPRTERWLCL